MNYYLYGSLLILYLLSVLLTAIYNHTFDHTHFTGNLDGTVESERGGNEGHRNKKFAPIKHKSSSLFQNQDISDQDGFRHHQQNIKIIEEISNNNNININENTSRVQRKLKSIEPSCQKKYPESCYIYPYIKYWSHEFSERDCYVSPTKMEVRNTRSLNNNNNDHKEHKYLVFRHDSGGWNNIRCAFESIVVFAVASGRTLVLPPKERWAWLDQNQEHENNLSDFYTFVNLKKLEGILHIISMEEFLNITAKRGLLRMLPPDDVMVPHDTGQLMHLVLWKYLYEACFVWTDYNPADAFFEFALRYDAKSKELLFGHITESTIRFAKFLEHWKRIPYLYNETIHNEIAIFFPASRRDGTYRETATFYRYIYFEDPNVDATMKRIIRDRTHYNDEIMCAAGIYTILYNHIFYVIICYI